MQYQLILSETFAANDKLYNSVEPFRIRQYLLTLFLQNHYIFKINSYIFAGKHPIFFVLVLIDILHVLFHVCLHGGKCMRISIPFPTGETIYKNAFWFCDVTESSSENRGNNSWLLLTKKW